MDTVKHLDRETLFSISFLVPTGTILWVLYWLTIFLYRAYFSPLSHIPGPRLAAATFWYEFYYEIYPHKFQYLWKIKQLHEQYGPIVRINPIHVHIHDHDYFDTIYAAGNRKRNRCSWYMHTGSKNIGGGLVEAIDHDTHRMKRKAAEPFFSKRSVQALEGAIVAKVEKLLARFSSALTESRGKGEQGAIVNLSDAMGALTLDVISDYSFGEPMGALEKDDYGHDFVKMLHDSVQLRPLGRQFPTVVNAMFDMPVWLATRLNSQFSGMVEWMDSVVHLIDDVKAEHAGVKKSRSQGSRNIFHEILEKDLPPEEKETQILLGSAMNFLGAGTETTARTLAVTSYYVLNDRDILDRLRKELKGVMPTRNSKPSLPQLEALPFLVSHKEMMSSTDTDVVHLERRNQRRSAMCSWRKRPSTSNSHGRRTDIPTIYDSERHAIDGILVSATHRPQGLP
jgi:cytochrome P450